MLTTDSLAAAKSLAANGAALAAPPQASVDFQNFLKLLTAQLRNQDPLSPLDSTQFVAQLASFSTVEQLVNANTRLDAIASQLGGGLNDFAAWIGREAETTKAPVVFSGAPVPLRIAANPAADRVELVIRNESGAIIHRTTVANSDELLFWNGETAGGPAPPGAYQVSADYFDDGEFLRSTPASTFSTILGARLSAGEVRLQLASGVEIAPADIDGLSQRF